jgi:hypothetical protein
VAGLLQRKCACGGSAGPSGECAECRKKRLQRKTVPGDRTPAVPPIVHEVLRSPGQPLDEGTRSFFEPRLGHDFSRVRIHTDSRAAESAQAVGALAYTVGSNVAFNEGRYEPGSTAGRRLLAHELAHVVQQEGSQLAAPAGDGLAVSPADHPLEARADAAAESAIQGRHSDPGQHGQPQLQRQAEGNHHPVKPDLGEPLPYVEATELLKCIKIMGEENAASCRQQILGEAPELSAADGGPGTPRSQEVVIPVPPPPSRRISPEEARSLAAQPQPPHVETDSRPAAPAPAASTAPAGSSASETASEPFSVGTDLNLAGTSTSNHPVSAPPFNLGSFDLSASLVLRHLHKPFSPSLDFVHDPSFGLAFSFHGADPDGNLTAVAIQAALPFVNYVFSRHGQDFVEISGNLGLGLGTNIPGGGLTFQEQAGIGTELHLSKEVSLSLSFSGSLGFDALHGFNFTGSSAALSGGLIIHLPSFRSRRNRR